MRTLALVTILAACPAIALPQLFMTRTERTSPTDPGTTTIGLGVVLATPRQFGGNTYDKLFYQLQP